MKRLLVASDLTKGSDYALGRGVRLAKKTGAALRIVHATPHSASDRYCSSARKRLLAQVGELSTAIVGVELDLSIRMPSDNPSEAILAEAKRFGADLILLGAHGEPKRRDAIFGTTATQMIRSGRPVLVVQNDDCSPYSKVMAAVDDDSAAELVLSLAFEIAPAAEVFAVHAFDPPIDESLAGGVMLEDVSADQQSTLELIVSRLAAKSGIQAGKAHAIAREGDVTGVLTECWTEIDPDLLVMGTEGRVGFSRLFNGSFADFFLLQCPSDMLVVQARSDPN